MSNAAEAVGTFESLPSRTCINCKQTLPLSCFYPKGEYFDSSCKTCKRDRRKPPSKRPPPLGEAVKTVTRTTRRNTSSEGGDRSQIEPPSAISYELWEQKYGRALTPQEKNEIRTRLTEFSLILLSEARAQGIKLDGIQEFPKGK